MPDTAGAGVPGKICGFITGRYIFKTLLDDITSPNQTDAVYCREDHVEKVMRSLPVSIMSVRKGALQQRKDWMDR